MQISSIIRQIQSHSFRYEPAELHISTRNPEMDADWEAVWEEIGVLPPSSLAKELKSDAFLNGLESIAQHTQEGDQLGNIAKNNVSYGELVFQRYIRSGVKEVQLQALPRFGVSIDVRIYPPEIKVETKGVVRE
ncbi:DUF6470 family protein [Paenibacillus marinisediminis]